MMTTDQYDTEIVICALCDEKFLDWVDGHNLVCDYCENFEPLDFDERED
jgi:hypothetical protein